MKYRVEIHLQGGMTKPSYDGYVDVFADDVHDIKEAVARKLHNTSFSEYPVWQLRNDIRIIAIKPTNER